MDVAGEFGVRLGDQVEYEIQRAEQALGVRDEGPGRQIGFRDRELNLGAALAERVREVGRRRAGRVGDENVAVHEKPPC